MSRPTQKEPRLASPLGGPHALFDGSLIIEFLQPAPELDASFLFRATYVGGHELIKAGKKHPQAPPLHIHFSQSESFIIESGAIGTTTTYDCIDSVHTPSASHLQSVPRRGLSPPVPSRVDGVTEIRPWLPHNFWPVAPDHPFWSTEEGQQYEATLPNGRNTDTTALIWGHPRTGGDTATGKLKSDFPPDMDGAYFLALLSFVDAISAQRVAMNLSTAATLFGLQTESDSAAVILAPTAWWLGPLRWMIPWSAQCAMERVRKICGGKDIANVVEDIIEEQVVKRQ